jgi:hypothetical protein
MATLRIEWLNDDPLKASAAFHSGIMPQVRALLDPCITLVFVPAAHEHSDWRRAAIAMLARAMTPQRVNALASEDEAAIASALVYLEAAPGLTGQYLPLDGIGAGDVIPSA